MKLWLVFVAVALLTLLTLHPCAGTGEVVYAINCGGLAHTDLNGIHYEADEPDMPGTPSDFGRSGTIRRVPEADQILYQTERYHTSTFSYEISIETDGDYVLILKFAEVYFTSSNQKVFDVRLNGKHTVVENLDIFDEVGRGVAHDIYVPFRIDSDHLHVLGTDESSLLDHSGSFSVDFVKGNEDNPKINAIVVLKGTMKDVPKLPEWPPSGDFQQQQQQHHDKEGVPGSPPPTAKPSKSKFTKTSGPKSANPYDVSETWYLPVVIAIGLFIPTVICLCRIL